MTERSAFIREHQVRVSVGYLCGVLWFYSHPLVTIQERGFSCFGIGPCTECCYHGDELPGFYQRRTVPLLSEALPLYEEVLHFMKFCRWQYCAREHPNPETLRGLYRVIQYLSRLLGTSFEAENATNVFTYSPPFPSDDIFTFVSLCIIVIIWLALSADSS
jgi:hypothetical protein